MSDPTARARKLLEAYEHEPRRVAELIEKAPATLAAAITLAEAAEEASEDHPPDCLEQHRQWRLSGIDVRCRPCEALAEWGKLFPETQRPANGGEEEG